ncbi:MAG: periplasmic heavy metal sensor [Thermodesulfobacteriota bacterium]|nr:periplasmic heavy metal sensor [Thermodesulfobacteriota bacterium]
MKRFFVVLLLVGLAVFLAGPASSEMATKGPQEELEFSMNCGGHSAARDYMRPEAWESLTSEQRDKWSEMWGAYLTDTLDLRQQFAQKRLELQTTWAQPKVDSAKVDKVCDEMADLYIERMKKRKDYLLKCRKVFGDLGWTCPSGG